MSPEQGKRTGETPRYSRSLRKAFAALENATLSVKDPSNVNAMEQSRIDRARTRLEARGVPQNVIEQHTIPTTTESASITETDAPTQAEPQYGNFKVGSFPSFLAERLDPSFREVHDTATWDAILSGKPVMINFEEAAQEGYTPRSPQLRPVPPVDSAK